MASNRRYRSVALQAVDVGSLLDSIKGQRVVVGTDIAKKGIYSALMCEQNRSVLTIIRWNQPSEGRAFVDLVGQIKEVASCVEVVMEPSSTYGDPLRSALEGLGIPVFRVNPKRSHDAAEVFDGVPSLHDAKCATLLCKLHVEGISEPWSLRSAPERAISAAVKTLRVDETMYRRNRDRLEGVLARHWPEFSHCIDPGSATALRLLAEFGGPQAVVEAPGAARELMRQVGGQFLRAEKIEAVIASAKTTFGVPPIEEEVRHIKKLAREANRSRSQAQKSGRHLVKLTKGNPAATHMSPTVGKVTAAVLIAAIGDPNRYTSPQAYRKALGLNLREKSSGTQRGNLHITKRGPGVARMFLYMAALRLIQHDPIVAAWYGKKVRRDGGKAKKKAVVAVMRKLALALWHVARGNEFRSDKLFDTRRLNVRKPPAKQRATP